MDVDGVPTFNQVNSKEINAQRDLQVVTFITNHVRDPSVVDLCTDSLREFEYQPCFNQQWKHTSAM